MPGSKIRRRTFGIGKLYFRETFYRLYGAGELSEESGKNEEEYMAAGSCDVCVNYVYDEECEYYYCLVNLDEDEMYRFLSGTQRECPYFRPDDEYAVVRHQM